MSLLWQWYTDTGFHSLEMIYGTDSGPHSALDIEKCIEVILIAPFREELLFRVLLFRIIQKTCSFYKTVLISNVCFSAFHLLNLTRSDASYIYVSLQVHLHACLPVHHSI